MKRSVFFLTLLVFGIVLSGCTLISKIAPNEIQSGDPLFADEFSDSKSGWDTWKDENGSMVVYQNNGLRILVNKEQFDYWSRPGLKYKDVRIEVDAAKVGGPNDNDFGVICRYQDRDNFYALLISSDRYYGVLKVKDGVYSLIGSKTMEYSEVIHRGDARNHIRVDCVSDGLILWANGEKLVVVRDGDFSEGDVGLIAGTNETIGVDIFFDNFVVYNP
jgi:hypothetical protein